ncbi:restriction endonuclease [Streptomyces sp. NPDC017056]|uniref:restriction endonuclease n=1 Tax=Streptomyces sp. NPDC017056 TaxID=3364973 RepID=UPI00378DD26C
MRRTLFVLAVVSALACGVYLALQQLVRWALQNPGAATVTACAVLPVALVLLVVAIRGMPRMRELRRAARAGRAEAEAELEMEMEVEVEARAYERAEERVEERAEVARGVVAETPAWRVEDFLAMDADAFEQAIARLCERDGCRDVQVVGGAGDLGADVLATAADGRRLIIQCKRYCATNKVGSQDVQRFGGTCFTVHEAEVAAVVTTSAFTEPAAEYAATCGIRCYDGELLVAWANGTGPAPWT